MEQIHILAVTVVYFINVGEEVNRMLYGPKDGGQGMTEFGVIIMLVAMVVIILLILMGPSIGNMFSNVVADI
jgi:Flp pilus assembly pilin Flp